MEREELASWLRLTLTPGVGDRSAQKLLAAFGLPEALFGQPMAVLKQVVSEAQALALRREPPELVALLDLTWNWLQNPATGRAQRHILALGDVDYPASLLNLEDPPLLLYLLGAGSLAGLNSLAVVGSRNPTPQGAANARQFAKTLAQAGLTIISGLALGIDGAAHEGALESLAPNDTRLVTVAVVGTGLDRVYPKSHLALAHQIAQNGLLISEYPLGTPPLPANFPKRNRLIAGLAQGTLVIEAALKSGSLITARLSAEQGKEVFAIPGSIHATQSHGCHALIRQGAKLVESAQDVLEELKMEGPAVTSPAPTPATRSRAKIKAASSDASARAKAGIDNALTSGLFDGEPSLLEALGFDPVGLDALQARASLDTAELQAQLMALELDGLVARLPGGLFQRLTPV
ncbi:MAG: DNA processing protein [Rhodoferax sp.]|jgi:DNA processing protein